jgi:hypothetical protein
VPARIISASIDRTARDADEPYEIVVNFVYFANGTNYRSSQLSTRPQYFGDYSKAQKLLDAVVQNPTLMAWHNPAQPGEAILIQPSYTIGIFIFLPLIFVAVGCGVIWLAIKVKSNSLPKSSPPRSPAKPWMVYLFFGAFFGLGFLLFVFITVRPLWRIQKAKSWPEVPCRVESSHILTHHGDKSDTYSLDILYAYEFNGKHYKSNRYHFMGGSSSGYKGKRKIIEQFSAGKETVCYVNPADPYTAVLNRGFTSDLWFGLIPLLFTIIGAAGLIYTAKKRLKQKDQTIHI